MKLALCALLAAACVCGCDDDDDNGPAQTDAGVTSEKDTFLFTKITLTEPSKVATILTNLLNTNLGDEKMYLFAQLDGWKNPGGELKLYGGAGQYVAGKETAEDFKDDVFKWLTAGKCLDAEGKEFQCSVDVGQGVCTRNGDQFETTLNILNIYSDDSMVIFPIKEAHLKGQVTQDANDPWNDKIVVDMKGVIIEPDTISTHFRLTPQGSLETLKSVLDFAKVAPDTSVTINGEEIKAYTFAGSFEATRSQFAE